LEGGTPSRTSGETSTGTEKDRVGFRRGEIAECPVHRVIEPGPGFL
jgi:hypothetical protein